MASEQNRDRGKLFTETDKKKPSQPDMFGDCVLDQVPYEIRGWRRGEEVELAIAPPRGDKNTYPKDVFKGSLDPVERPKVTKGKKGSEPVPQGPVVAWTGVIKSDEKAFKVIATEKQGKTDIFWTLAFEPTDMPSSEPEWVDADAAESAE